MFFVKTKIPLVGASGKNNFIKMEDEKWIAKNDPFLILNEDKDIHFGMTQFTVLTLDGRLLFVEIANDHKDLNGLFSGIFEIVVKL
jgi:hypothetical protein